MRKGLETSGPAAHIICSTKIPASLVVVIPWLKHTEIGGNLSTYKATGRLHACQRVVFVAEKTLSPPDACTMDSKQLAHG